MRSTKAREVSHETNEKIVQMHCVLFTLSKIGGKIQFLFLFFSCGPSSSGEMVSRRKILSRSRDDLHMEAPVPEDEEDIWYHKEKLYKVRTKVHK